MYATVNEKNSALKIDEVTLMIFLGCLLDVIEMITILLLVVYVY